MVPLTIRCGVGALYVAVLGCAADPTVSYPTPTPALAPVVDPAAVASRAPNPSADLLAEEEAREAKQLDADGVFYVLSSDPQKPAVRYPDGQLSRNLTCPVQSSNKLSRRIPPVYINGQPIGFCSVPCPDVFVQDVPEFVRRSKLTFSDYLDEAHAPQSSMLSTACA